MPARIKQDDESAWFYHSPFDRSKSEKPATNPLMSQIPGINGCPDGKETGPSRPYYKDTDTKYVRLAKQGGRRDLLNYHEFDERKEAVAYPRVDWFYLEDNALEDAKKKKDVNWKFGVPEYMTQTSTGRPDSGDPNDEPQKLKASADDAVIGLTDAENPADNLQMDQLLSYPPVLDNLTMASDCEKTHDTKRDRSQRTTMINSPNTVERAKAIIPEQQFTNPITQNAPANSHAAGLLKKQDSNKDGQVSMSKLLSYSYAKEWHEQLKEKQSTNRRVPFHTTQEIHQTAPNASHSSNRATPGGDEGNEKANSIGTMGSVDESEISDKNVTLKNTGSVCANNAEALSLKDPKTATGNK